MQLVSLAVRIAVRCVNSYSLVQLPDVIPGTSRAAVSGSIEEAWYDSLAMSESDAEDDFHSVQDGKTFHNVTVAW